MAYDIQLFKSFTKTHFNIEKKLPIDLMDTYKSIHIVIFCMSIKQCTILLQQSISNIFTNNRYITCIGSLHVVYILGMAPESY